MFVLKRLTFTLIFLVGAFAYFPLVFAVGGGGGGSAPSCDADIWDCGGWSQCSLGGAQTRVCSLTFDCSTANTPKPAETQSCIPPAPPQPPSVTTPEVTPGTQKPKLPVCTKDVWTCGNWSATCDTLGRESRTCKLATDCPGVETPPPASLRACTKIQCGAKATLQERISCRLNLAPSGAARELELQYLPEACRVKSGGERKECVELYKSFQPCWKVSTGEQRFSCARNVLKLGPVISGEVKTCQSKKGAEQVQCKSEIKEKVLYMTAFRFYDLETRAEELANRGASLEKVVAFETAIEIKKQEFDKAATNAERRQIILDVRQAWQDFINQVKDEVK